MIELMPGRAETKTGQALPFVSVVMPIRNEASFIRTSLGAVLAQVPAWARSGMRTRRRSTT